MDFRRRVVCWGAALALLLAAGAAHGATLLREALRLPAAAGADAPELEAALLRPEGAGPFPVAILSHGTPREASRRPAVRASSLLPQAGEFARRGFAALIVLRRGYGGSGGPYVEGIGSCASPDYERAGRASAQDVLRAMTFMRARAFADPHRLLLVGVSAGGLASLAAAAEHPPGLVATVNFAGGRGSRGPNDVCDGAALTRAFAAIGARARAPSLWIYAENDLYFGPQLAAALHRAYTGAGAPARLVMLPPFGQDGHLLFSRGIPLWTPIVAPFLAEQGFALRDPPLALPPAPAPALPAHLGPTGRAAFQDYLAGPPEKAFALSAAGAWGWAAGRRSVEEARQAALEFCKGACRVIHQNDAPVP
jgi:dienelactone hydrolase